MFVSARYSTPKRQHFQNKASTDIIKLLSRANSLGLKLEECLTTPRHFILHHVQSFENTQLQPLDVLMIFHASVSWRSSALSTVELRVDARSRMRSDAIEVRKKASS